MPDNFYKLTTLALVAGLAYDFKVARHNRKARAAIVQENEILKIALATSVKQTNFLADKLNEADVKCSEFDAIVFRNL